jgi:hypothetical protein
MMTAMVSTRLLGFMGEGRVLRTQRRTLRHGLEAVPLKVQQYREECVVR